MTKIYLLETLKTFTEEITKDLIMPVKMQKDDTEQPPPRAADIYKMRLTKSSASQKAAPYIIHSVITGRDSQNPGQQPDAKTVIRSIFCVYNEDEQEGALMLLNLMERFRVEVLKKVVLDDRYQIDLQDGLDSIIYPDEGQLQSYYAGEYVSTWTIPAIKREVFSHVN